MFVTRTVASEVCMEAKINEPGYRALKLLDRTGHLRFELRYLQPRSCFAMYAFNSCYSTLVCDLIKVEVLLTSTFTQLTHMLDVSQN